MTAIETSTQPPAWFYFSKIPSGHLMTSRRHWVPYILKRPAVYLHKDSFPIWVSLSCSQSFSQHHYFTEWPSLGPTSHCVLIVCTEHEIQWSFDIP